ncbi:MAG: S49 family peptidase, partial [Bradymonadaceae bacterium]
RLGREARSFYRRFLRRVGAARQLPRRRLHRYARGRIYTGEQARDRNLVDELGDFETAFETVCRGADIDPDDTQIAFAPHRRPNLGDLIGLPVGATTSEWWPESLSEAKLAGEMLNREGFLALSPVELDVGQGR